MVDGSMGALRFEELVGILREAGIEDGDVVHVQGDLRRIGLVDAPLSRESILSFYLEGFREAIGADGTITSCTAFEDYGRYGAPYVVEESPSRTGAFSEYLRTRSGAVRSIHPIVSVCGLGAAAEELCGGAHYDGFSYDSPWGRLHRANAKIMTLGLGQDQGGLTFMHYAERLFGVPYQYTKLYDTPVYAEGGEVAGPFTMSVRYLDFGIADTAIPLKRHMVACGKAIELPVGGASLWIATAQDIVDCVFRCLRQDRFFLLCNSPNFRKGEIPFDGVTGDRQHDYDKNDQRLERGRRAGGDSGPKNTADSEYISEAYWQYQQRYARRPRESDRVLMELIEKQIAGRADAESRLALLDIGCSNGNLLRHLKSSSLSQLNLFGGEIFPQVIERCRTEETLNGIGFDVMDVLDLGRGELFDIVVANAVLGRFDSQDFVLACGNIARSLRPGGAFIAFDWYHAFDQELIVTECSGLHPEGLILHVRSYAETTRSLKEVGFSSVAFHPFEIPIELPRSEKDGGLRTHTRRTSEGENLQFRGSFYQPWCHMVASRP